MIAISLQSGSNGNCIYVEAGGVRLLIDAGISGLQAERRLEKYQRDIRRVDGVLISHDHSDHVKSAGIFARKFGLPLHFSHKTHARVSQWGLLDKVGSIQCFAPGEAIDFGPVQVETVPTPHDGCDGCAFVICQGGKRLGVLTDLGHVFKGLGECVSTLDGVFLESNYDPHMLEYGPYPPPLKTRIKGPGGHLSNGESAKVLSAHAGQQLQWAVLAHLSEQNNEPRLAMAAHHAAVGGRFPLHVASRYDATGEFSL